jgi:hypothetical protein
MSGQDLFLQLCTLADCHARLRELSDMDLHLLHLFLSNNYQTSSVTGQMLGHVALECCDRFNEQIKKLDELEEEVES